MKLIVCANMFTLTQMAYLTENVGKEVKKTFAIDMRKFEQEIFKICDEEEVLNITISGPMMYTKGLEKKLRQAELIRYNQKKFNIQLIK